MVIWIGYIWSANMQGAAKWTMVKCKEDFSSMLGAGACKIIYITY